MQQISSHLSYYINIENRNLHRQITKYVENDGILTPFQIRFRSGVSSQYANLYLIETLRHEIEKCNLVHAVILDLSKAFDWLLHRIFSKKNDLTKFLSFV